MCKMKDSGIEWIGNIPEKWNVSKIKYNTLIPITDGPHETPVFVDDGVPFYSVDGIQNEHLIYEPCRYISVEDADRYDKKIIPLYGDVLMGKAASVGKIAIIDKNIRMQVWSPLAIIRTDETKLHNIFLKYYLLSDSAQTEIDLNSTTNTQKNIAMEDIENIVIVIPGIKEQQLIADFLDDKVGKVDEILVDLNNQVEILQKYKKSVITKAVTKGLSPNVTMKDSGIDWIGEIPESWELSKIKYKFGFLGGYAFESDRFVDETDFQVLRIGNVKDDNILFEANPVYIEKDYIQPKFEVKKDYILFTMTGTRHKKDYFYTVCIDDEMLSKKKMYTNQRVGAFYKKEELISKYFSYLFKIENLRDNVFLYETGTVNQGNIGIDTVGNTNIVVPSIEEQREIVDYLDDKCAKIDELIKDKQNQIEKMEKYKKSLIYEYVTGKKRVKGV